MENNVLFVRCLAKFDYLKSLLEYNARLEFIYTIELDIHTMIKNLLFILMLALLTFGSTAGATGFDNNEMVELVGQGDRVIHRSPAVNFTLVDSDNNSLYNYLKIDIEVSGHLGGRIDISVDVQLENGRYIGSQNTEINGDVTGVSIATVLFSASTLNVGSYNETLRFYIWMNYGDTYNSIEFEAFFHIDSSTLEAPLAYFVEDEFTTEYINTIDGSSVTSRCACADILAVTAKVNITEAPGYIYLYSYLNSENEETYFGNTDSNERISDPGVYNFTFYWDLSIMDNQNSRNVSFNFDGNYELEGGNYSRLMYGSWDDSSDGFIFFVDTAILAPPVFIFEITEYETADTSGNGITDAIIFTVTLTSRVDGWVSFSIQPNFDVENAGYNNYDQYEEMQAGDVLIFEFTIDTGFLYGKNIPSTFNIEYNFDFSRSDFDVGYSKWGMLENQPTPDGLDNVDKPKFYLESLNAYAASNEGSELYDYVVIELEYSVGSTGSLNYYLDVYSDDYWDVYRDNDQYDFSSGTYSDMIFIDIRDMNLEEAGSGNLYFSFNFDWNDNTNNYVYYQEQVDFWVNISEFNLNGFFDGNFVDPTAIVTEDFSLPIPTSFVVLAIISTVLQRRIKKSNK